MNVNAVYYTDECMHKANVGMKKQKGIAIVVTILMKCQCLHIF